MADQTISKNATGYNYKYADLAQVNEYISNIGETYYQYIETKFSPVTGEPYDYIHTVRLKKGSEPIDLQGCRVIEAELNGKSNAAQEAGSGLTYARRYSLYMAYGLATEDDDGEALTKPKSQKNTEAGINFNELRERYRTMSRDELRREYMLVNVNTTYTPKQKASILKIIDEIQKTAKKN